MYWDRQLTIAALVTVGVIALMIFGTFRLGMWSNEKGCTARWAQSGMPHRWEFFSGCMVQRKDGTWVPASTIRELTP